MVPKTSDIFVVIPAYKCEDHIKDVVEGLLEKTSFRLIVVDDACPNSTGSVVLKHFSKNKRVHVSRNQENLGVGGAWKAGALIAQEEGASVIAKFDGDGQMNPKDLLRVVDQVVQGSSDFAKGNRFKRIETLGRMPFFRLLGNGFLSVTSKFSTGYWTIFDPTNGLFAMDSRTFASLPIRKIANNFFFESDLLFRLGQIGAKVIDVPIDAHYGNEKSNLKISRIVIPFGVGHAKNFFKRIINTYFLFDWSPPTFQIPLGLGFFGLGLYQSISLAIQANPFEAASPGEVSLGMVGIILGVQLLLAAISHDISKEPSTPISSALERKV